MSLTITQTKTALAVKNTASFLASGGTGPYTFTVAPGGAGGTIGSLTGLYIAPTTLNDDPSKLFDTIEVVDSLADTGSAQIMVGDALLLFCEILERSLGLAQGRVFLWNQKIFKPTDDGLFIVVSVPVCKPFGNTIRPSSAGWSASDQHANMLAQLDLDIISRGPAARTRKEEVMLALNSIYSQAQQEANSFSIGRIPAGARFNNLSDIDGAAIPYRYRISVNMQYTVSLQKSVDYYDTFESVEILTNP